jgi:hypothetical protein
LIAAKDSFETLFFALALFKENKGSPGAGHPVSPTKVKALAVSITKRNLDFLRVEDFGKNPKVLNPSNFALVLLHITSFLILLILSISMFHYAFPVYRSRKAQPLSEAGTLFIFFPIRCII